MTKLGVKRFSELGVEKLGGGEVVEASAGEVYRPAPIERELKVVRVGPNPRLVVCEYWELAERRTTLVNVRNNQKFFRGMVFRMEEPVGELEFQRPWLYTGKLPRRRGRW